ENDVTAAIATGLRGQLSGERAALAAGEPRGTDDLEAYNLFLRGRYAWSKRGETSLRTAIDLFNQALTRDPSFARAHAGLAMAYVVLPVFTTSMSADSATGMAMRSANRALAIDSTLADAHLALAYAHKMRWEWSDAERHFRVAASLAPDDAGVHHWYGVYLYAVGEVERSAQELSRARELDPFMATIGTDHAVALYGARRFDEARAEVHRAFVLDTTKSDTWFMAGLIQLAQGRPDSALVSLETARRRGTGFDVTPYLSAAHRALGDARTADSLYVDVRRRYAAGRALAYDLAVAAASAGDVDAAMAALRQIVERRDALATELPLPCDPLFDALKVDPRFERLLTGAGMKVCPAARPR
ncbi:MAG TPA: tetratricopeptide repeat protein, partial [Gemmatimonadaceae bacterium]|nr:tetratricopeptide repeat protein [Gemmatimonadaceae bacterium]